jgi:hypothetical protein
MTTTMTPIMVKMFILLLRSTQSGQEQSYANRAEAAGSETTQWIAIH